MRLLLSKFITLALSPTNWVILFTILYFIGKPVRFRRFYGISIVVLLLIFTNPGLYYICSSAWQPDFVPAKGSFKAVILPGGLSSYDKNGQGYFGQASDRFIQAAKLVHTGVAEKIIVTGGNGFLNRELPPEAVFIKEELLQNGIPDSSILIETNSRNTQENALFTKKLVDSLEWNGPFVLVTSAMHMRRCQEEFKKAGLRTTPHTSNYEVINGFQRWYDWLWPEPGLLEKWTRLNKEILGWLVI